jgi:hypothetical protein
LAVARASAVRAAREGKTARTASAPAIRLRRKAGGKAKRIATGFAWDLFLFAGVFGLPLFWRRLHAWGAAELALWCLDLVIGRVPVSVATRHVAEGVLFAAFFVLQLTLGFIGNRLTAKAYVTHGWTVDQPGDLGVRRVIERWKLGA